MSIPSDDRPARDTDRDAAIRAVESAWADGQIVEADRDRRVDELRHARTLREIETHVRDLRAPAYQQLPATPVPPDPVDEPDEPDEPDEDDGPVVVIAPTPAQRSTTPRERGGRKPAVSRVPVSVGCAIVVAVAGMAIAVLIGIISAIGDAVDGDAVTDSPTLAPGEPAGDDEINTFSRDGWQDYLSDLEAGTGGTEVFSATVYPTYVVADVPVDDRSQREQSYYWNGELDEPGSKGTSTDPRYDLRAVDWDVVVRLVERVRARVEDPTSWYVILHAPREDDQSVIQAYASNEYGESAYVLARVDGKVTYRSDPPTA